MYVGPFISAPLNKLGQQERLLLPRCYYLGPGPKKMGLKASSRAEILIQSWNQLDKRSTTMEILNIERWDSLVEFRRDLRDAHYYQQVVVGVLI